MESKGERKSVRVIIYNQPYTLGVTGEPGEVESLAHAVDDLMTGIAQRAGNVDALKVAVLACLQLADQSRGLEQELAALRSRQTELEKAQGRLEESQRALQSNQSDLLTTRGELESNRQELESHRQELESKREELAALRSHVHNKSQEFSLLLDEVLK